MLSRRFRSALVVSAWIVFGCSSGGDSEQVGGLTRCNSQEDCGDDTRCSFDRDVQALVCMPFCNTACDSPCVCESETSLGCEPGAGCVEPVEVGEACRRDDDCVSGNCSPRDLVCRVAVGETCTVDDCDRCIQHEGGWSYCSRECDNSEMCNEGFCIGTTRAFRPDSGLLTCVPPCEVDCPTQCDTFSGGSFCECEAGDPGCTLLNPPLELGEVCRADVSCASGECYNQVFCDGDNACDGREGLCTISCTSSDECIEDYRCVGVLCDDNGVTGCAERRCLPVCDETDDCPGSLEFSSGRIGTCQLRRPTEGEDIMVCDIR